ncbi:MAG: aspartate ammonia-lyase [Erysipelotrichaceae bacterium]|nr:aspartate ammonia-lyase [Erysipelotrichaceae bacterium]
MERFETNEMEKTRKYYGDQTKMAQANFNISKRINEGEMIRSLAKIKQACAMANLHAGTLTTSKANAIVYACDAIIRGHYHDQFVVDPIQGGAGTSANMNANEVIANIAQEYLDRQKVSQRVHPNDDVNLAQSTNDVYPSAGKLTIMVLMEGLVEQLRLLEDDLGLKKEEFRGVYKVGRTQLQDAVVMSLGQSFQAYRTMISRDIRRINQATGAMKTLNLGATAIGSSINTSPEYLKSVVGFLSMVTGFELIQADDLFDATSNIDSFGDVSSSLKNLAVNLNKMANDLRLLASGPRTGFNEITLPYKQNGSSIMPGKVNPVILEVVNQVAFLVMGNDLTVSLACQNGQLELNAFEPVAFSCLFESITTLTQAIRTLRVNCIQGIKANRKACLAYLDNSIWQVTPLAQGIGYDLAASLAKEALHEDEQVKKLALNKGLLSSDEYDALIDYQRLSGMR